MTMKKSRLLPEGFPIMVKSLSLSADTINVPYRVEEGCLLLIIGGKAQINIDLKEYHVEEGWVISLIPNHYITDLKPEGVLKVRLLAFNPELASGLLTSVAEYLPTLMKADRTASRKLSNEEKADIEAWFNIFERIAPHAGDTNHRSKVEHLLLALQLDLIDHFLRNENGANTKRTRKEEIMANFMVLLGKNIRRKRDVGFYASELCITPKHLTSIVKDLAGISASHFISRMVVNEAEVLLKTTQYTIQQISDLLEFPNQSFFGKYFKKKTGLSPIAYRQRFK